MTPGEFRRVRESLNLTQASCARLLVLDGAAAIDDLESGAQPIPPGVWRRIAELDSLVETLLIDAVDAYSESGDAEAVLIRFLNDADLALYEPDQHEKIQSAEIHGALIDRLATAIETLGGRVLIAFMDAEFYETWLGINDFDDGPLVRTTWARQQIRSAPSQDPS